MSSSDEDKKGKKPPPSFSGSYMSTNISLSMDDGGEEVTRRVGGAAHQPNFSAMGPPSLDAPSMMMMPSMGSVYGGETFNAAPQKASAQTARPMSRSRIVADKFSWKLKEVPTLPEFHPLERTAVLVEYSTPSEVSARISDVLRERSIEAFYEDDKAKVRCLTPDGVDFRVRLYRGRGKYSHGIIVEVQRRFGASVSFHNDTWAILDAAQGRIPPPPPTSLGGTPGGLPLVSDTEDDDYEPSGADSLKMVSNMFSHAGYDAHCLALQTLASLTDSSKMGMSTARSVSKELLRPDNEVGNKVLAHVLSKRDDDMFQLHVLAMTILANAIYAVKGKILDIVREQIRPVLIYELKQAQAQPRAAQMAARCVEWLIEDDHDISEFHTALETALVAGTARHAGLMRQAQVCLDKIQGGDLLR